MTYQPREIEEKWQDRWAEGGRYHADPEPDADEDATFVTVPYPYPSGGMHIGHARTYTVPDVYARYRRLQGDNVLFPIAWHVTGTPIIGAVNRLQKGEEEQLSVLRDTYNVPEDELETLETPMGFARYFIENHYKENMQSLGLSIDWRREFTTNDERYSKFVTWQYETLRDHGRLEKGLHPVKYCTDEENPVTTHDILEGEEAEFQEYTLVKFGHGDTVVPMATLRPETVRGVTNAYIDPDADYVEAEVDGERWLVSDEAAEKLVLQQRDVRILDRFTGDRLVGERVTNPVTGEDVLVLPADFVDADNATGVVMSVPAHSPDDWVALEEAKADDDRMREYGIDPADVDAIEPKAIIDVEAYDDEFPARAAVAEHGIESSDDPALEDATQQVYNREFHSGTLKEMYGEYAGEVVEDVRDELADHFQASGEFDTIRVLRGGRLPLRRRGRSRQAGHVVPHVQRRGLEGTRPRRHRRSGRHPGEHPRPARPHRRLAERVALHPELRPRHPAAVGRRLRHRTAVGLDGVHVLLHHRPPTGRRPSRGVG